MKVLLCNNASALRDALNKFSKTATVEAEYGDDVVSGSVETLAHHGPRSGAPCPCLHENQGLTLVLEAIGISHVDLDTLGGILALTGKKPNAPTFWDLAAFVDINGAHKLGVADTTNRDLRRIYAWWAWEERHPRHPEQDGSVSEVTDWVEGALHTLHQILDGRNQRLVSCAVWKATQDKLNAESFLDFYNDVIVRVAPTFVNHLYVTPEGYAVDGVPKTYVAKAIVGINPRTGEITISLADPIEGVSCHEIVQECWGSEAGGHDGIAGSPRDRRLGLNNLVMAFNATVFALTRAD